jgi:hypothetical protein
MWRALLAGSCLFLLARPVSAADFNVSSPGFFFSFNGGAAQNPTLNLVRGKTYTFAVNTSSFHPFEILGAPPGSIFNNNISSGTVTFNVPTNAMNYSYICSVHFFGNSIVTVAPPPPPNIRIVGLSVTTNIVLISTGTNTWSLLPQYSTNLSLTNWTALAVNSNIFVNGTNETFCGKPPGKDFFIRIKATQK